MQTSIDDELVKLFEESKEIIDKINKLMLDYKAIDDNLNLGFVNESFCQLLDTNIKNCDDLGMKIKRNSQKFVIFGETNAGKSSFINSMIFGSNILPTGSASTTKCFVEIKQSIGNDEYLEVDKARQAFSELKTIVTSGNNRKRHVNLFYKFHESDCFTNNIILDTPGTDFDEDYDEKVFKYCHKAAVVILVVNASNLIGNSMKRFCQRFINNQSNLNLYVVFNKCDILELQDDWRELIKENEKTLFDIFSTKIRDKMAYISSSERMKIITNSGFVFNEQSRRRSNSFIKLSEQLKNERRQISMRNRYDYLHDVFRIMDRNKVCLSEMKNRELKFFEANFSVFCDSTSFNNKIEEIFTPFYETLIKAAWKMNNNRNFNDKIPLLNEDQDYFHDRNSKVSNDSEEIPHLNEDRDGNIFGTLLSNIENEIKQKVKDEIINYIERNNNEDQNKLIFVLNNVYFPKIMDKIHLVDTKNDLKFINENKGKIKIAIGAAAGGLALGVTLATIPAWPVILALELEAAALVGIGAGGAFGGMTIGGGAGFCKVVDIVLEKVRLSFVKKFRDEIINSFSDFEQQIRKYPDLVKQSQYIDEAVINLQTKTDCFKEKVKCISEETYKSLSETYYNINELSESQINKCLQIVNEFIENYESIIIDCLKEKKLLDENLKVSLNCLYVSINIISKYIENHQLSTTINDSSLIRVFDGFFEMIFTHNLAERICESILYALCSLMKLENKKIIMEFWKEKLEICFQTDKISEENKLASSVILVQMQISNSKLLFEITNYLFNKIDLDFSDNHFGFSRSEINSARRNALNHLKILLKTTLDNDKDHDLFIIYLKNIINLQFNNKSNQSYVIEMKNLSDVSVKSFETNYENLVNEFEQFETLNVFIEKYFNFFVHEFPTILIIVENILSHLDNELDNQLIGRNENISKYFQNYLRNCGPIKDLSSTLAICFIIDCDKTTIIEIRKYLNESNQHFLDNLSKENIKLALNILDKIAKRYFHVK